MRWFQRRDPVTTVISYELEDEQARVYATITHGGKKGYLAHVPPSIPFSRSTLQAAKNDAAWIINNRK